MQIRRGSKLNCINSIAIGWPIGLILDGQKAILNGGGNGEIKLQNVWFAGMDVVGTDANKVYEDVLVSGYDSNQKPIFDKTKTSFSGRWFLAQSGNKYEADIASLKLDNNFVPQASSPVLSAASFKNVNNWFEKTNYIGAFGAKDNWTNGWTNFDPQNTEY